MATDRVAGTTAYDENQTTAPPGGERPGLQRSHSAKKKNELLSTSLSASAQASLQRQLRQHRNSWPTIEAASATAAAKAIKRTYDTIR